MKKYFNFLIIALLIIILFLSSGQKGCKKKEEGQFNTTALIANFVENAPPDTLVTNSNYLIYVDIKNSGGYDIPEGAADFYLRGVGENLKNVKTHIQNSNFLSKKTPIQEGGSESLVFATKAEPWKSLPSPYNITLQVDSYYKYSTIAQTSVCVGKGNSICSPEGEKIKTGDNSAGPIQITSLKENILGNKLYITFKVENKGAGEVYLPSADCNKIQSGDVNEKLKKDKMEISVRAEEGITCKLREQGSYASIDSLNGISSIGQITCEKSLSQDSETHLSPIEIVVSYLYTNKITKNLMILPAE